MSIITINVEFTAGTDISVAVSEAIEKAKLWNVAFVSFNFNGVTVNVSEDSDIDNIINSYYAELKRKSL